MMREQNKSECMIKNQSNKSEPVPQDHRHKSELLLQAIGELPDEMIAQAAPQNLQLTKHRGAKLLHPQMLPAAAMVGIGVGLCLLAHHYTSQNNGDPNVTMSSEYAYTNTSPEPDDSDASGATTNETGDNSNSIANLASSLGLQVIAYAKENADSMASISCYSSPTKAPSDEPEDAGTTKKSRSKGDTETPTENSRSKSNTETQTGNSEADDAQQSQSEPLEDYKKVTLKAGNPCLLGEYSPYMSSVPAMPFSFELSSSVKNIRIEVAADSHGSIQLWSKNTSEGSLTMTKEAKKLSCKPGDIIYWAPKAFKPGKSRLTVRLYKGSDLLGTQAIRITCDKNYKYRAKLLSTATAFATPKMDAKWYSTNKAAIQKRLASYPASYSSVNAAAKKQVLMIPTINSSAKQTQTAAAILNEFVSRFQKCKKQQLSYKQALVIVQFTVEGDAIYDYILNKDGTLYIYEDTSRDAYAGGNTSRFIRTTTVRKTSQKTDGNQLITYEFGPADNNCSITLNNSKQ